MSVEIGSDYALETWGRRRERGENWLDHLPRHSWALVDSGRTALRLGLRRLGLSPGNGIHVPAYTCPSVIQAIQAEGITPVYYRLGPRFEICLEQIGRDRCDTILVTDYFGIAASRSENDCRELVGKGYRVLHDISHSVLAPLDHLVTGRCVCIASLRKTLPLPDGGLFMGIGGSPEISGALSADDAPHALLRLSAMVLKSINLTQPDYRAGHRERFLKSEQMLESDGSLYRISKVSEHLIPHLDMRFIADARRANFMTLLAESRSWQPRVRSVFEELGDVDVPLGFPVLCAERDRLRQYLIQHRIYPPIHWQISSDITQAFPLSLELSETILTLPCDHRYGEREMKRMASTVARWCATR